MTISRAVDCATVLTASSTKAIKVAGDDAVLRYLGHWAKSLAIGEPSVIHDAGLALGLIYEGNPTKAAYFTTAQALSDVTNAVASAKALGAPAGVGIAFAVDYDAQVHDLDAIVAYCGTIIQNIGPYKPGVYADDLVLDALYKVYGNKLFYWQTSAWSDGAKFPHAVLYQDKYDQSIGGVLVDVDEVYGDPGWWTVDDKSSSNSGGGTVPQQTYQSVKAALDGKTYLAVEAGTNFATYLIWTAARDTGCNLTKVAPGDVEIDGKKPSQVYDGKNTFIEWSAIPTIDPHPVKDDNGVWQFRTVSSTPAQPTAPTPTQPAPVPVANDYQLVVDQPSTAIAGRWALIIITTQDNGQPLGNQVITVAENGVQVAHDYTDATTGGYEWQITETTNKTDSITVTWVDPSGKTHTVTNSTQFQVPAATPTPLPSDDSIVAQFPLLPTSDVSNAILFAAKTTDGKGLTLQLDTGAFELMLNAADAKALNAPNLGVTAVQGVGGQSQAYYSQVDLVIGGVTFKGIKCVVDPDFTGNSLFGYQFFIDNKYDFLVSQKHNTVTFCK